MSARICIVADIHHGKPSLTKRGDAALTLMEDFVRFTADAKPDVVLDLGDRISDEDRQSDLSLERDIAEAFKPIAMPVHHINGNHDRDHLDVADNEAILGQSLQSRTFDIGAWRIALWRADTKIIRTNGSAQFVLPEADSLWLSRTIQTADRPLLVVSHVPISGHAQTGNYYFENNPHIATYPLVERLRAILAQARAPVVCLAGHVHWNTVTTIDGITHLTQQSLTESFTTKGEPAGAMGLIELGDRVTWRVVGRDPIELDFTPCCGGWTPPLHPFSKHAETRAHGGGDGE